MLRSINSIRATLPPLKLLETATGTCVSCRGKRNRHIAPVRGSSKPGPTSSQLDGMDLDELQPQYRHIEALQNAPEEVRKIFTLKFGSNSTKLESKYLEYAALLQRHKHDYESLEIQIAQVTVKLRSLQEYRATLHVVDKRTNFTLKNLVKKRNNLLLELRSTNFERYCLALKVLDVQFVHWPEYDVKMTKRLRDIIDMKTRVFAEIQRRKNEKTRRAEELEKLQAEILEKLKSGELVPSKEELDF